MTIGSELRDAREQRGVSLREISERTNIRLPVLRAIENDDFRLVPGSVIMRGFLKLYAREVGLDPEVIGRRYTEQLESSPADRPVEEVPAEDRDHGGSVEAGDGITGFNRLSVAVAAALLVLMAAGYLLSSRRAPETVAADRPGDAATPGSGAALPVPGPGTVPGTAPAKVDTPKPSPLAEPAPAAVGTAAASVPDPARASSETPSNVVRVDLQATGEVWIAATADGRQVAYRMLASGERLPIRATREAILRIGIPANVTVSINDQPIRPFERPGTPTTLTITPANYRELLAR
jgi:transcriptional regulator with XRE-family HTH domain